VSNNNDTDEGAGRAPKSFLQTIAELQFGHFEQECTDELRKAILAVARTEKSASVTVTLKLKHGKGGQVEVDSEVSAKLPKDKGGTTIMFISPEFNLQRNDPRQMELQGLRVVGDQGPSVRADDSQPKPTMRVG
jgi:hypothetical protein